VNYTILTQYKEVEAEPFFHTHEREREREKIQLPQPPTSFQTKPNQTDLITAPKKERKGEE
jgi:hypothetical protein